MTKKDNYKSLKFKKLKAGKTLSKNLTIKNDKNDPLGALIDDKKYAIELVGCDIKKKECGFRVN